ncbi:hypothetical protein SRDD_44540 [Serratia sp. DD3]|nr:hypothetical protein SRDD_44540 [Serratia sp. DD3]
MSLTDIKAKNAKPLEKEYKLTDGFDMFLRVCNDVIIPDTLLEI